ncbi:acetyltransferase [Paenibacillus harenae]|uniref:acetyltransferase n=1 Tax=Paenibacillus harenae TaxID=306543 RepID=UPI00279384A8|nr:acetyltransferase [Paenibacillus harenae]MDQ0063382.1 sugar O-acyltransferase (sialic acid O-acetyltransferase NeuD family) [Paenibacillus harenae]
MKSILVYGAGGHAKVVIDVIEKAGIYRIAGLLDGNKPVGTNAYGYSVLGDESYILSDDNIHGIIVAIGDNWLRAKIVHAIRAIKPECVFITAIHPQATVARGAVIGEGTVLMAGAVVNSDTIIGSHCVLNTISSVDHDSRLDDYVTMAPHAATGGGVRIESYCTISIGASLIHSVTVHEHTVIGAGATVLSAIESYSVAYGTPARVVRKREAGERYL